jgi:hypothetical protein
MLLLTLAQAAATSASRDRSVVVLGLLSRALSQSLGHTGGVVARRPPAQLPGDILESAARKSVLGEGDGALERLDLGLVRLEEVPNVDLAIGIRVAGGRGGDEVLGPLGEACAFGSTGTGGAWGGRLLPLVRVGGHGHRGCSQPPRLGLKMTCCPQIILPGASRIPTPTA